MIVHQSMLAAWSRCPAEVGYKRAGVPSKTNSAAAYGSVIHHVLQAMERSLHESRLKYRVKSPEFHQHFQAAVQVALESFVFYWNPHNIETVTEPVPADGWLPRAGYAELRARGLDAIRKYADLIKFDDHELLALEYGFMVPIDGTWDYELNQPHMLGGSVDRLAARHFSRQLACCVDDYKTGKEQYRLRYNIQFTAYCYATTKLEFWVGHGGEDGFGQERGTELYERFKDKARRGTWINMRTFKYQDAGWREATDYARFALAVDQIASSIQADIFPLTISGDACTFCDYRSTCGGTGIAEEEAGSPAFLAAAAAAK